MGSVGISKSWVPYMNPKDCSQGFCSIYCPQWCYIIFPPPPPVEFPYDSSGPSFSPLVIAVIGILASAFLLVSYYAIISKYCGKMDSARRENRDPSEELEESDDPSNHEPWHVPTTGLDEALIKSITVCKYKKGDGLIEGTDCSVCLSEFDEDESLRLLPKCSHAFHVTCIDTWLKSHSNCPLCRANIIFVSASSPLPLPPVIEAPPNSESLSDSHSDSNRNEISAVAEDVEICVREEEIIFDTVPKPPSRTLSDLGNLEESVAIIEIRDEDDQHIRRSVSMDYSCHSRVSIAADVLRLKQDHNFQMEECQFQGDVGSSKRPAVEISKSSHRNRVLQSVMSPVAMKRSFSSGRFSFSRCGRGQNTIIPL